TVLTHAPQVWRQLTKYCIGQQPRASEGMLRSSSTGPQGRRTGRSGDMGTPVVLITGALTGIGRAAALAFARDGHRTVVAGRHEEAGQKLVTELRALGTEAEFIRTDVRHEDDVQTLVDRTVARFGRL